MAYRSAGLRAPEPQPQPPAARGYAAPGADGSLGGSSGASSGGTAADEAGFGVPVPAAKGPFLTARDLSHLRRTVRGKSMTLGGVGTPTSARAGPPPVRYVQALLCEFVGSFFLTLAYGLTRPYTPSAECGPSDTYFAVGATAGSLVYAFSHVSGGHFNPVVTMGFAFSRQMSTSRAVMYCLMQLMGAFLGGLIAVSMSLTLGEDACTGRYYPAPNPNLPHQPILSAVVLELLFCALVVVVAVFVMNKNMDEPHSYAGLAIGSAYAASIRATSSVSGGFLNPAAATGLSFASIINDGTMRHIWVYWLAALLGSALGAALVHAMKGDTREDSRLPSQALVAEFFGTLFLTMTAALNAGAVCVGLVYLALVFTLDHISGAEINPAVTFGLALRLNVRLRGSWRLALVMLTQFLGGVTGAFLAYWFVDLEAGTSHANGAHGSPGALFFEMFWSGLLILVVLTTTTPVHSAEDDPNRTGHSGSYHGIAIGWIATAGMFAGGKLGGGSGGLFNPAMGTGLSLVAAAQGGGGGRHVWIYWVGPFVGAVLAAGLFKLLHYHKDPRAVGRTSDSAPSSLRISGFIPMTQPSPHRG